MGKETEARTISGWMMLVVALAVLAAAIGGIFLMVPRGRAPASPAFAALLSADIVFGWSGRCCCPASSSWSRTTARCCFCWGWGTVKASGFHW